MIRLLLAFFACFGFLFSAACSEKQASIRLNIKAKTNRGDAIDQAQVLLGGTHVGTTDNFGALQTELEFPINSNARLEVKKDSDLYYFAPYFENFAITDQPAQDFTVDATLYFVPKPSPDATQSNSLTSDTGPANLTTKAEDEPNPKPAMIDSEASLPKKESSTAVNVKNTEAAVMATDEMTADKAQTEEILAAVETITDTLPPAVNGQADTTPNLTPLAIDDSPQPQAASSSASIPYPARQEPPSSGGIYTLHVHAGDTPLSEAEIFLGQDSNDDLTHGCTTNARGRCVIRFHEKPAGSTTFIVSKEGFKTKTLASQMTDKGSLRVLLERGQTLDVYAVTKTYNHTRGLKDVEVYIGGKRVGSTDRFGHYSYVYDGKIDDLVGVSLKPAGYIPETYETDFVASGPMTLVRYFSPIDPPPARISVLNPRLAGDIDLKSKSTFSTKLDEAVRSSARKHLFSSSAFKEYPLPLLNRGMQKSSRPLSSLTKIGWQNTDLKATVDAVLIPTLVHGKTPALELSLIDSKANTISAASHPLDDLTDTLSIDRAMAILAQKITRTFPFEGAVLKKEADDVIINLGYGSGRGIKPGDVLDVSGVQTGKTGRSQTHKHVATLTVKEVFDTSSKARVSNLAARASLERGDLVVFRPRKAQTPATTQIRVSGNTHVVGLEPLEQANIYFNDVWIGTTDAQGRIYSDIVGRGQLKVIKHGYQQYSKPAALSANAKLEVNLRREAAFIRVDSQPSGVNVKVDGVALGKTPLKAPIPVPSGFVKLEIDAPSGYKPYNVVLELDQGTLDLTGPNIVKLEPDYRAAAQRLLTAGRTQEALAKYAEIPDDHSDYLLGRHEAGELYLTQLDQPAKAAEAFGIVTANEAVKRFSDKRFIGSHINEGIALFLVGNKLAGTQPEAARAHYRKAIEVFEAVIPHLRFISTEQYSQAVHNVDFHRALARHKLWQTSKDPRLLTETVRSWRSYLDGSARTIPAEGPVKSYVENAEVYFKQAIASQALGNRNVSRQ